MTQEEDAKLMGRRIRALRGNRTQADFAELVGVTRSALANYETGRTVPSRFVVMKMASALGVAPSAISAGQTDSFEELALILGAKSAINGMNDLTNDEKAVIRCLRACEGEIIKNIAKEILKALQEKKFERSLLDNLTFPDDYIAINAIASEARGFERGITVKSLQSMMERLGEASGIADDDTD
ncbi:helix-turn-helix domain-containing protein [Anianabacter salinae]|uniref:helix-turn-helix domain-containing protein n=1 Tax=Anianabacter salinae TaxID=2851023 RepID=UPI00225E35FF|nr:helix-turn-helix transcriptional regulator [Anianabacter salinae]